MIKAYKDRVLSYKNEFLWIGIGLFVQLISGLIIIKLLAHSLNPDKYGTLNLFNSILQLIMAVILTPLMQGASRFAFFTHSIQHSFQTISFEIKKLFYIIFSFSFIGSFYFFYKEEISYTILALFSIPMIYFDFRKEFMLTIFYMDRKRKLITYFRSIEQLLRVIFVFFISYLFRINVLSVIGVYILVSGISFWLLLKKSNSNYSSDSPISLIESKNLKKKIIDFAIPCAFLSIFTWSQTWADRWVLNSYLGLKSVGIYTSYSQISNVPFIILTSVTLGFFVPILFKQAENVKTIDEYNAFRVKIRSILLCYMTVSLVVLAFIFISKEFVLKALLSGSYIIDSTLLVYISIGSLLSQYSQVQTALSLNTSGDSRLVLYANIVSGITYFLLLVFFIKKYSIEGVPFAFILCNILRSTLLYLFSIRSWNKFKNKIVSKSIIVTNEH